ncbi:DUF2239 family protein [Antarcticimicrobium sediminis]|uniref:DUF2239 family protein n=1 Tax=Antarcticimicrobium sediminis TaxID=2546227 RepID=A0A4R5EN48_9RHOB|nr:DUF2239 family protein [Antarcticimicrobium sediminis]
MPAGPRSRPCTAFSGTSRIASGPLAEVALALKSTTSPQVQVFDDKTGAVIDLDLRGSAAEITARLSPAPAPGPAPDPDPDAAQDPAPQKPRRGRPKLGVVAREVTLLPRHWDWLAAQPGGASAALRRLVEAARRQDGGATEARAAREACYRFLSAMAGDLPGFEEAARALFADDMATFTARLSTWPDDIRAYARQLAAEPATP